MMFLISSTGHGWREIQDEWDFPRVESWIDYCNKHPALREMVAAYLGIEKPEPIRITDANYKSFCALLTAESRTWGSA